MFSKINFFLFCLTIFFAINSVGRDNKPIELHNFSGLQIIVQNKFVNRDTLNNAIIIQNSGDDSQIKNRLFQQVPSIAATADGNQIFVAWYSGGENEGNGNYITVSVSPDNGTSWFNDQLIIFPKKSTTRFFDPALWRDNSGNIHLYYASSENPGNVEKYKLYDLKAGVNELDIHWDGSKIIYNSPKRISDGIMMNNPVYIEKTGFVLFPVSLWKPWIEDYKNDYNYIKDGTFIYHRKFDKMKPDTELLPYSEIEVLPDSIRKCDEHMVAQSSENGGLLCLVRTKIGIYYSRSKDYGITWTKAELFTATGPTTSSRVHLSKLRSGKLLLVLNDSKTRTNMTAFLSEDGGYTWPYKLLLDDRESVSYPDADQTDDGNIHVVFDYDRFGTGEILYCRFTEEDIIKGASEGVYKKRLSPPNVKSQSE